MSERSLEESVDKKVHEEASALYDKYGKQFSSLESKSPLSKVRAITSFDLYALGNMFEAFNNHKKFCEADGTLASLGNLPNIALDVLTVSYGQSPMAAVASMQPIKEELGSVYFKGVVALDTAGNLTADQDIINPATGTVVTPEGYAAAELTEDLGDGDGSTVNFTATIAVANRPIRPFTVSVSTTVGAATVTGTDDGAGNILGAGINGNSTINYTTGAIDITYTVAPDNLASNVLTYSKNMESADLNRLNWELTSTPVRAKVFALRATVGMLKSFAVKQRFGMLADEETAQDLVNAINAEVFGDMAKLMDAAAYGNLNWDRTAPSGVSEAEHRDSLKFTLADLDAAIVNNAGRGGVSYYIAGTTVVSYLSSLPGYTKLYDGVSVAGAHIHGTLDGVPVIRIPITSILAATEMIAGFKGSGFESAVAHAPYMPLTATGVLPTSHPLMNQRAAAVWAGNKVLIPKFMTKLTLTQS